MPAGQTPGMHSDGTAHLSTEAVYGNISNFIVAGHETTANTLAFIVTMLALRPDIQSKVHEELDHIFGTERILRQELWSYEQDFPLLLNGLVGAVQNETLRLFPLSPTTTRKVLAPQEIYLGGERFVIPAGCRCFPNMPATHTNPKYWGPLLPRNSVANLHPENERSCPSESFVIEHKVRQWDPMRWLSGDHETVLKPSKNRFGQIQPIKPGAYLPFSRGPRGCIGTRFAQVELCAFMARLFAECEVRVDTASEETTEIARNKIIEQITTKATTTLTYKPADDIKLVVVPRFESGNPDFKEG